MILDTRERNTVRFYDRNRLVEDALAQERERKVQNIWTEEEKRTFIEKYLMYPKNFREIAASLPGKTTADCVSYYYTYKYTLNLKKLLRENQMKRKGMRKVNLVLPSFPQRTHIYSVKLTHCALAGNACAKRVAKSWYQWFRVLDRYCSLLTIQGAEGRQTLPCKTLDHG